MKAKTVLLSLLFLLAACKKDVTTPATITLQQLVAKVIGYYTATEICTQNNGNGGFTSDTAGNLNFIISTADDTTIIMDGAVLHFTGNLATAPYYFYSPASGGGYNAVFDSSFHNIQFGIGVNGMAGGSCGGSGSK